MKAIISRASAYSSDIPPCEGATRAWLADCWRYDVRVVDHPSRIEFFKRRGVDPVEAWQGEGWDHEEIEAGEDGRNRSSYDTWIRRKMPARVDGEWIIEVDDLAALVAEVGDIVFGLANVYTIDNDPLFKITIYDDYLE